jgi:putative hydrolase of the HAD superfamily
MFVAFDVGETLIQYQGLALDWSEHYRPALNRALSELSVTVDDEAMSTAIEVLSFYNTRNNPRTFEVRAGEVTSKIASLFEVPHREFENSFFSYFQRRTSPTPGASQLLAQLKRSGAYLAALSDVPYGMPTAMLVNDLGALANAFDCVASSCDVGTRKPHKKGLRQLLRLSNCSEKSAYYIGNEPKDVEAANSAKMHSILFSPSSSTPNCGQTHTVSSLAEVAELVL